MSGLWYRAKWIDDVTGCVHSDSVVYFTHCLFLYSWAEEMSDIEVLSSESSSERSEVVSSSEEEDGGVKWG